MINSTRELTSLLLHSEVFPGHVSSPEKVSKELGLMGSANVDRTTDKQMSGQRGESDGPRPNKGTAV